MQTVTMSPIATTLSLTVFALCFTIVANTYHKIKDNGTEHMGWLKLGFVLITTGLAGLAFVCAHAQPSNFNLPDLSDLCPEESPRMWSIEYEIPGTNTTRTVVVDYYRRRESFVEFDDPATDFKAKTHEGSLELAVSGEVIIRRLEPGKVSRQDVQ